MTPEEKEKNVFGNPDVNYFAMTNFRNKNMKFGIKLDDRRRHLYVVGKTGMGKTTMLENMVLNDIYAGHGVGVVDPHGDFAEKIIDYIPAHRINDVVYFNPADIDYPIGFNILESIDPRYRHLVASGLMGVFKKIWPDVWSARMEYILNNTLLALLEFPNTTLLGINRLLADDDYRKRVIKNLKDPVIRSFWEDEFESYNDRYKQEAVAPVQNKIGQFLSASVIRNIVAQVKSRINIREIMDTKKIFIMNLSKGRIGEDNSRLLGGMLITKIQLAAMERVDTPEKERKDFFLYVDEFQNFATESFSNILSEARKYRLDLTMAHQYMEQLDETVLAAVIGNVGTLVTFRVGSTDAEILAKEFAPIFIETDLVNLTKFQIYLKLMIDGVASQPFSANTLSPINLSTNSAEKVIKVSRERYATNRENIEDKIMRWTGMGNGATGDDQDDSGLDADDQYTEDEEGLPVKIEKKIATPPSAPAKKEVTATSIPNKQNVPNKSSVEIKSGKPISLVNTNQKGVSFPQISQTNNQPIRHPVSPNRPNNSERRPDAKPTGNNFQRPKPTFNSSQISRQPTSASGSSAQPKKTESNIVVTPVISTPVVVSQPVQPEPKSLTSVFEKELENKIPTPIAIPATGGQILPDRVIKINDVQDKSDTVK